MQRKPSIRLQRELESISKKPPPGISCVPNDEATNILDASILGLEGTPYESGIFKIAITIPDNYPFEPPQLRFTTRVYHPNIDDSGRICLDLLKLPPQGSWSPVNTIEGLLLAVQQLLVNPNPLDPLMIEIAEEYQYNLPEFKKKAQEWTQKHAFL